MSLSTTSVPIKGIEGETKSLTTTVGYVALKPGFNEVMAYADKAWRIALGPKLMHALLYDGTNYTDYRESVTDRSSGTHLPLDGMTTSYKLYLGFSEPALGVYFDLHATNVNAINASLDVEYCSTAMAAGTALAWTDVAGDSDGTLSGSATLATDGVYTWTLPGTAWKPSALGTWGAPIFSNCYWIRMTPSTTLSATIDVEEIIPVYQNANYGYMAINTVYQMRLDTSKVGSLVVLAGENATLNLSWLKY